jgi:ABC-type polysaccharide/polyol phosphate transport system ATPase subunit
MPPIIEVQNVTKTFQARTGTRVLLGKGGIKDKIAGKKVHTFDALQEIDFNVDGGESLGIIGSNGSGKSTLLKLIAGVTVPTTGTINVYGRVASLLELGAGFHPMLTGRENVFLNAGILGMRHKQVAQVFDEIVEFSGIGSFIEQPVDTYSSGMYVRIAFAVAAYTNPDIFLIDEVLSVGDEEFQRRCRNRIGELMEQGKTIVFVSHDLGIVNSICQRVILLSQGKMILRDTTSKAIDFYLRQIGEEKGLHTMHCGDLEAIQSNGRISLFYKQEELTPATGLQFQVFYMGQWHLSKDADWEIGDRTDTSCVARGTWSKLKTTLVWTMETTEDRVNWSIALECDEATSFEQFETNIHLPPEFTQWVYEDENGPFPEIRAEDTTWQIITSLELVCENAAALPEATDGTSIRIHVDEHRPNTRACWFNSDYMTGCRIFQIREQLGSESIELPQGKTDLLSLSLQVLESRKEFDQSIGERTLRHTVQSGDVRARFDRGRLRLNYKDQQLTTGLHGYASMFINNIWNDSLNLRWESFEEHGRIKRFTGVSRRFPYSLIWEISSAEENAINLNLWFEAHEDIQVQEFHTSLLLDTQYTDWSTDHESGTFPEITPEAQDWQHLNHQYESGTSGTVSGEGQPKIYLTVDQDSPEARFTILNTSYHENARVIQALTTPEHGVISFPKGTHPYFSGVIRIG